MNGPRRERKKEAEPERAGPDAEGELVLCPHTLADRIRAEDGDVLKVPFETLNVLMGTFET